MKVYEGTRLREVTVNGRLLSPILSQEIRSHSPDGFNWGYGGSGPAQLALAILLDYAGKEVALRHYQQFKWDFVVNWKDCWKFTGDEIEMWLTSSKKEVL